MTDAQTPAPEPVPEPAPEPARRAMPKGPLHSRASLVRDLGRLGIGAGDVVLLHVSMRGLGWVVGGAQSVIGAFLDVLGPKGTLCMPGHSAQLSDPGDWQNPPVPKAWHDVIRAEMPVFDPETTPLYGIGAAADLFWRWPGTRRSHHPQVSMLARGHHAEQITQAHSLDHAFGPDAPLGRVHDLGGKAVLLGVGYR
ncbi:MAG: aminoglycoside N(3)-acetyltransferase, partial [Paracoccaceae bacterium]